MFHVTGFIRDEDINKKLVLSELAELATKTFARQKNLFDAWYEIFAAAYDDDIWHFRSNKENYSLKIKWHNHIELQHTKFDLPF